MISFIKKTEPLSTWLLLCLSMGTLLKFSSVLFSLALSWRTLFIFSLLFSSAFTLLIGFYKLTRCIEKTINEEYESDDEDS